MKFRNNSVDKLCCIILDDPNITTIAFTSPELHSNLQFIPDFFFGETSKLTFYTEKKILGRIVRWKNLMPLTLSFNGIYRKIISIVRSKEGNLHEKEILPIKQILSPYVKINEI